MKNMITLFVVLILCGCSVRNIADENNVPAPAAVPGIAGNSDTAAALEELTELERSGGFVPGIGLAESGLRERSGDYAGAVLAMFKELSWAYSLGEGGITREAILDGLNKVRELKPGAGAEEAVLAVSAFFEGRWKEAETMLTKTFIITEADSYPRWMLLVCALEQGNVSDELRGDYSVIRARYTMFPEYWYRLARSYYGRKTKTFLSLAGSHAERCVNLAPSGPYASECRIILAEAAGLDGNDGSAIRTRAEIEKLVGTALEMNNPELLTDILPLVALPDNPYTVYASGALRALSAADNFRTWFSAGAAKSRGRLAERLLYISRG